MKIVFLSISFVIKISCEDICYDSIGCFTDDPPFSVEGYRPPKLPQAPVRIDSKFYLTNNKVEVNCFDINERLTIATDRIY